MTLFVSANPFAKSLEFAGKASLEGWKVAELFDLIQPATKLQTPEGTLDVFVEFRAKGGEITGGVKPVLKNVRVRPTEDNIRQQAEGVGGRQGAAGVLGSRPRSQRGGDRRSHQGEADRPGHPAVADDPRRRFATRSSKGSRRDSRTCRRRRRTRRKGAVEQAKEALDKDEGPPEAQPTKAEKKK